MRYPLIKKLQEEPQSLLAIGYLVLIIIGMINEACYYREFGINIFEYSEVFDFLIAPFKKIEYIGILMFSIVVAAFGYMLDTFLQRKFPNYHNKINFGLASKPWFPQYRLSSFLVVFLFFLVFYGKTISEIHKKHLIKKSLSDTEIIFSTQENQKLVGKKIGANKNYFFLLDSASHVHIIPTGSNIQQILPANSVTTE